MLMPMHTSLTRSPMHNHQASCVRPIVVVICGPVVSDQLWMMLLSGGRTDHSHRCGCLEGCLHLGAPASALQHAERRLESRERGRCFVWRPHHHGRHLPGRPVTGPPGPALHVSCLASCVDGLKSQPQAQSLQHHQHASVVPASNGECTTRWLHSSKSRLATRQATA